MYTLNIIIVMMLFVASFCKDSNAGSFCENQQEKILSFINEDVSKKLEYLSKQFNQSLSQAHTGNNTYALLDAELKKFKVSLLALQKKINTTLLKSCMWKSDNAKTDFLDGVSEILKQAEKMGQSMLLGLVQSSSAQDIMSNAQSDSVEAYNKKIMHEIQAQGLTYDSIQQPTETEWQRLLQIAKQEVSKAVVKRTKELLAEKGGALAKSAGSYIANIASDDASKVGEYVSGAAQKVSGYVETLDKDVQKKIFETAGEAVNKVSPHVKDFAVGQVKKLIENQTGIKAEDIEKIIKEQHIDAETMKKIIRYVYQIPKAQRATTVKVYGDTFSKEEDIFTGNRRGVIYPRLAEYFGVQSPISIGLAMSGGGNRALVGSLGFLLGMAKHKVVDVATHMAALSGSTWTVVPWAYLYYKKALSQDTYESLQEFQNDMILSLNMPCKDILPACPPDQLSPTLKLTFGQKLAKRFGYEEPITVVDIWGAWVAQFALKRLGNQCLDVTWSQTTTEAMKGALPLPLGSAIFNSFEVKNDKGISKAQYRWFETGPFDAGSKKLGYIPMWALGSKFNNGSLVEHAPEYEIFEYLGVYGSAFGLSLDDVFDHTIPPVSLKALGHELTLPVDTWVRNLLDGLGEDLRKKRSDKIHAQFANYTMQMPQSIIKDKQNIGLFDGGIYFNIPTPLLIERNQKRLCDLIIMYDSNPGDMRTLQEMSQYYKIMNIPFPDLEQVTQKDVLAKPMTVFNDPRAKTYNKNMPTVLYFLTPPNILQAPYKGKIDFSKYKNIKHPVDNSLRPYNTPNFDYSEENLLNLTQTMEAVIDLAMPDIKEIIKLVARMRVDRKG